MRNRVGLIRKRRLDANRSVRAPPIKLGLEDGQGAFEDGGVSRGEDKVVDHEGKHGWLRSGLEVA